MHENYYPNFYVGLRLPLDLMAAAMKEEQKPDFKETVLEEVDGYLRMPAHMESLYPVNHNNPFPPGDYSKQAELMEFLVRELNGRAKNGARFGLGAEPMSIACSPNGEYWEVKRSYGLMIEMDGSSKSGMSQWTCEAAAIAYKNTHQHVPQAVIEALKTLPFVVDFTYRMQRA